MAKEDLGLNTCCKDPCKNPNALEFGKCHKVEHNNGCGCSGDTSNTEEQEASASVTIIRSSSTRQDFLS